MPDVVVIGAGLAGLQCAEVLQQAGVDVEVWEAADAVGGRIRTDVVDGFRCDRGFQVLNPAYPAVRRHVDVRALALARFDRGLAVRDDAGLRRVVLNLQNSGAVLVSARALGVSPRAAATAVRWLAPALFAPARWVGEGDTTLAQAWDHAGVRSPVRDRLLGRFLEGVLLGPAEEASNHFVRLVMRSMVRGAPGLPAQGMAALPHQLAARLRAPVALGNRVHGLERETGRWRVNGEGTSVLARAVVVATDPGTAALFTGLAAPEMNGCVTDWFAAPIAPSNTRLVCIDGRQRRGPVVNTAVMSNVAPSYAPPGQHLVQATSLLRPGGSAESVSAVQAHAAAILQADAGTWRHIVRHEVPHAIPAQRPPLDVRQAVDLGDGRFVCGDHRDTASIQGAMVSGRRTGRAVARWLGAVPSDLAPGERG